MSLRHPVSHAFINASFALPFVNTLQRIAKHWKHQHTPTHCSTHTPAATCLDLDQHCTTLQHNAKYCTNPHYAALRCTALQISQRIATHHQQQPHQRESALHCSKLQHTVIHHNKLQHTTPKFNRLQQLSATACLVLDQPTATHCNTLQSTATHCNTSHHATPHCNTPQHTATHCNTCQRHSCCCLSSS